jgi:uncharacterized protein
MSEGYDRPSGEVYKILSINVTEECNLRCVYCYQKDRRNSKKNLISLDIVTNAIADHLTRDDGFNKVTIDLIGGEPFLYPELLRQLITWTVHRKTLWKKEFHFFIGTNGTLLNDKIKDWLFEYRDYMTVGLSLDGTPEAHNLNRSNSYDRIAPHIPFLASTWPNQTVKMTISPQTIPMIYDGIIHMMRQGFPVASNVAMEDIWGMPNEKAERVYQFRHEIEKLVDFFNANPSIGLPGIIDLPIAVTVSEERDRPWCGAGRNMAAIDEKGRVLPCHRFTAMSFDQRLFDKPVTPNTSRCRFCFFKAACQTCEVLNWEVNGNPEARTTFHCEFQKWQMWGTAQVHARRLGARLCELRNLPENEQKEHAQELSILAGHLSAVAIILEEFEKHGDLEDVGMKPGWRDEMAASN